MRIDIESKKRGYASLEVIAMSLIGFTLVLALLSIALNKRILIKMIFAIFFKFIQSILSNISIFIVINT